MSNLQSDLLGGLRSASGALLIGLGAWVAFVPVGMGVVYGLVRVVAGVVRPGPGGKTGIGKVKATSAAGEHVGAKTPSCGAGTAPRSPRRLPAYHMQPIGAPVSPGGGGA